MIYSNATAVPRQELTEFVMESVTDSDQFIGATILPPAPLQLTTGHYPKITVASADLMRRTTAKRAAGAKFERWQAAISDGTINLFQTSEEINLPDEQGLLYESYFDLESVFSLESKNRLQRLQEYDANAAIMNAGNFDAVAASVAYTAANAATISFVEDVLAAIRRVKSRGERANTIVLSGTVYDRIRLATKVQAFIAGANQPGAVVNPNSIQRAFGEHGITQVLIGDAYENTSEHGSASSIVPIWSNSYVWVGNVQSGSLTAGGVGRTFFWEREGPLFNISSYRDEPVKSNVIRAMTTKQEVITNARAGTLITTSFA